MPNPESDVIQGLRDFRLSMNNLDRELTSDMARRWLDIETKLQNDMKTLASQMALKSSQGIEITQGMLYKEERYQLLISQMDKEVLKYNKNFATDRIIQGQKEAAALGIDSAQGAIADTFGPVSMQFNKINIGAVENIIGMSADGTPLGDLLTNTLGPASQGVTNALIAGIATGEGASEIARNMAAGMDIGLDRALLIARTETNRAYRTSATEQYRASGLVEGFMRLVARDEACIACLMLDGERFDLASELDDHPNGRCTAVPIIAGMDPPQWETGQQWFENQTGAKQLDILGATRYDLYKNKGIPLNAFATKTHSSVWGDAPKITSVEELKGLAKSKELIQQAKLLDIVNADLQHKLDLANESLKRSKSVPVPNEKFDALLEKRERDAKKAFHTENDDKANDYFESSVKSWSKSLTKNELEAVEEYTDNAFVNMNYSLRNLGDRGDRLLTKKLGEQIEKSWERMERYNKDLVTALAKAPAFKEDVLVTRVFKHNAMLQGLQDGTIKQGDIIEDLGFMSTTLRTAPRGEINYQIIIPKGYQGAQYLDGLSGYPEELEILLPPGTKLKFLGWGIDEFEDKVLIMELVP